MATTRNRKSHVRPTSEKKSVTPKKTSLPSSEPVRRIQTAEGWKRNMMKMRSGMRSK